MGKVYDVAVVGAGTMGSFAGLELVRRGLSVLLLDRWSPPHDHGAHHGETRLYRQVYVGEGVYTPTALLALEGWLDLEKKSGRRLFLSRGVINLDPEASPGHLGKRKAATQWGVLLEPLSRDEVSRRWPAFRLPPGYAGLWEPQAGVLDPGASVAAALAGARAGGADLVTGAAIQAITFDQGVAVVTDQGGLWRARRVLVTSGTGTPGLLPGLSLPVEAVRQTVAWFASSSPRLDSAHLPGFTFNAEEGQFYGFPSYSGSGLKVGRHDGGTVFSPGDDPVPFGFVPEDGKELSSFVQRYLPGLTGPLVRGAACRYDKTPDEDFRIGQVPGLPLWYATGFSGHGFKFAPAVGRLLAEWVGQGEKSPLLNHFDRS